MKNLDGKKIAEYLGLIFVTGIVLFVSVNTAEAKKLFDYTMSILSPLIYGFCIAYVLNLFVKQFDSVQSKHKIKKGKPSGTKGQRILSIFLSIMVFVAFTAITIGMIIPNLKNTVLSLVEQAPKLWDNFLETLEKVKDRQPRLEKYITKFERDFDVYYDKAFNWIKNNWQNVATGAVAKIKSISNAAFNFTIGLVIAFAMLVYKERLVAEVYFIMKKLLPKREYGYFCTVQELANKKFQIFLKYNFVQALITGAETLVFMLVFGMPYVVSITLLITVTQLVPIIGAIVGTLVSALLIAAISPAKAVLFVILCTVVQQLVEKLINPHLMGKELEMPGLLTFIVICLGGKQFGLFGLICAVPFVSVFYDLYTQKIHPKVRSKLDKPDIQKDD